MVHDLLYIIIVYALNTWLFALQPMYTSWIRDWCLCNPHFPLENVKKNTFFEIWVVWLVMQLTPSIVTTFPSTLFLQKHINRGREVHEKRLESLHCHAGGIAALFSHTFSLESFSLCCRAWRMSSLEKRSSKTRSRFCDMSNLKRRYICMCFPN